MTTSSIGLNILKRCCLSSAIQNTTTVSKGGQPGSARQHGITNRARHGVCRRRERLGHEKGVAAGNAVQALRRLARLTGELGDGLLGEW